LSRRAAALAGSRSGAPALAIAWRSCAAALAIAALAIAAGCSRAGPARPRNVIFILVDTLRADHLPIYGYRRDTSPNLAALARESVVFAAARSQAACTFPSVNSILTSRSPAAFLGQPGGAMGLPGATPGLAEMLRTRGFHTVAISASPVVRKSPTRFNPAGGFDRGFELFDEQCLWRKADCVTRRARAHLRRDARPLLLYLHYMDPHGPYAPPPEYRRRFALAHPEKDFIRRGDPNPIADWLYKGAPNPRVTPADLAYLADLYDDDIAFFDSQLARLLADLRASGLADESIVVFASDHGEEFLEHGHMKHCHTLFDTSVRTPLLLRIPGLGGRTVAAPVENLDLVPTLLDYLGLPPAAAAEGRSLRRVIERTGVSEEEAGRAGMGGEEVRADQRALGETREGGAGSTGAGPGRVSASFSYQRSAQGTLRAVCDGRFKLIHDLAGGSWSLYDLGADPGETRDVLAANRPAFFRLREALATWVARAEGAAAGGGLRKSREADQRLRALGYLD
jgi:arylsulfatase A-like enzyme